MRKILAMFSAAGLAALCPSPARAQAPYPARYYPRATVAAPVQADGPAAFLAALNAWRAGHGRPPVGWDATLAAYAAANTGVHAPQSRAGSGQCWAGTRSMMHALSMWQNSPAHASILLNARSAVGVAYSPSGVTANAR